MSLFDGLETYLREDDANTSRFMRTLQEQQRGLEGEERAGSKLIERLVLALDAWVENEATKLDIAVLVRGVIRAYERRLMMPVQLWEQMGAEAERCGVYVTEEHGGMVDVFARPWHAGWLSGTEEMDRIELRRKDLPVIGDAHIFGMRNSTTYQSEAQKAAVDATLFAPAGSTTLVTLPTGAGKSTCLQIPAWIGVQGGREWARSVLVVVPTVALALDQQRQALEFFGGNSPKNTPQAWWSGTSGDDRQAIMQGLLHGTLPLLFTAPESLVAIAGGTRLYDVCLEAAERGHLTHLVIDEAHIVESWGQGFRTEFQMLSAFRRVLLERSDGKLRTVLLSATVSDKVERDLDTLFADDELRIVRANRLRPEPAYWMALFDYHRSRKSAVLEALRHVQRPAILYVNFPEQARDWVRDLCAEGYGRVAGFTGETPNRDRRQLIHDWQRGRIDVMVATSAFGLGVDKEDIRTVIHACVPEGIDRFYQEVGRGGRDGCSSASLLLATERDLNEFKSLGLKSLISPERALERWHGMRASARPFGRRGDDQVLDMDAVPVLEPEMGRNEKNRGWNEHIVLLMQRAGLIRILDTQADGVDLPEGAWLPIRYLNPDTISDSPALTEALTRARDDEFGEKRKRVADLFSLVTTYARGAGDRCLAYRFQRQYPSSVLACGGCSACRQERSHPYVQPLPLRMEIPTHATPIATPRLDPRIQRVVGSEQFVSVLWEGKRDLNQLAALQPLFAGFIVRGNFQQLFVPQRMLDDRVWRDELVQSLAPQESVPHLIAPVEWLGQCYDRPFYPVPTVVVYPPDNAETDRLHTALLRRLAAAPVRVPLVCVVHLDTYLPSQDARYADRVDGVTLDVHAAEDLLTRQIYI